MKITERKLRNIIREVITDMDTGRSRGGGDNSYAPPPAPSEEEVRSVLQPVSDVIMELVNNSEEGMEWTFHIDDYIKLFQQKGKYISLYSYALDWLDNEGVIELEGSSGYYQIVDPEFFQVINIK